MKFSKNTFKGANQENLIKKPKKNPKADVSRNESVYFAVGLLVILLVTYATINYKTFEKSNIDIGLLNLGELDEEEIPLLKPINIPPPIIPKATPFIEIIEDDVDIEEDIVESTEINEEDKIMNIEEVVVEEVAEDIDVPFAFIENVPIYPGCEKGNNAAKRKCMSSKIQKFVQKKFDTELAGELGLIGKQRIIVVFKIDKRGKVVGVRSRAPHPRLEKEAARVINLLPQMKPGIQRDKAVNVSYSLPIIFVVQD